MTEDERFDRLLKAMTEGEPHKASARKSAPAGQACRILTYIPTPQA